MRDFEQKRYLTGLCMLEGSFRQEIRWREVSLEAVLKEGACCSDQGEARRVHLAQGQWSGKQTRGLI